MHILSRTSRRAAQSLAAGFCISCLSCCSRGDAPSPAEPVAPSAASTLAKAPGEQPPPAVPAAKAQESALPPPGIAFDYVLDHGAKTPAMDECHLQFSRTDGTALVDARMIPVASHIIVKVPFGSYHLKGATCTNGRHFIMQDTEPFPVADGTVTFLGEIRLEQGMASKAKERDSLKVDAKDSENNRATLADLKHRGYTVVFYQLKPVKSAKTAATKTAKKHQKKKAAPPSPTAN